MSWQGDGSQSGRRRNMAIKSTMNRLNAGDKNDNSQILYFCKNDAWEIRFLLLPHRHCQRLALGVCCDRFQLTNIVDRIYFSLSFTVFFFISSFPHLLRRFVCDWDPVANTQNSSASTTLNNILFAVKTWSKNHVERLPIIQRTWGAVAAHIRYFSDKYGMKNCRLFYYCCSNSVCMVF